MAEDQENRPTHNSPVIVRVDPSALESSWVPNKDSLTCQLCFKGFTLFDRRHHCRACGALVCGDCSSRRVFDRTKDRQVRVCSKCFSDLRQRVRQGPPGTPVIRPAARPPRSEVQRKLAVLGFRGVGKSALVTHFAEDRFVENYNPTIEATFQKELKLKNVNFKAEIVDTAGMDEYMPVSRRASVGVHGYVLMYCVTSRSSFDKVQTIHERLLDLLGHDVPRVLVGSMLDLVEDNGGRGREIRTAEGADLAARWGVPFMECSSKRNFKVTDVFVTLLHEIERCNDSGLLNEDISNNSQCAIM